MSALFNNAHTMKQGSEQMVTSVGFRAPAKLVGDVIEHQTARKLPRFSDAARELLTLGVELAPLVAEARALDIDPVHALRAAIAAKLSNV